MFYKKLNLTLYPILVIVLFFTIPFYNNWLYSKVLNNNFFTECSQMDLDARNIRRFGYSYTVYKDIQNTLGDKKDVTLLLPPDKYVATKKIPDLVIPEPAVFYYFTGIKSVWANSPDVSLANWVLLVRGPGQMLVKKISVIHNPDSLLADYKKYIK